MSVGESILLKFELFWTAKDATASSMMIGLIAVPTPVRLGFLSLAKPIFLSVDFPQFQILEAFFVSTWNFPASSVKVSFYASNSLTFSINHCK